MIRASAIWSWLTVLVIRQMHGLDEDADWSEGGGPEDYEAFRAEYEQLGDRIHEDTFREYGEADMGELFLHDPAGFMSRCKRGIDILADRQRTHANE